MFFEKYSLLRSGGEKISVRQVFSREQRLAVNIVVGLKYKCSFPL